MITYQQQQQLLALVATLATYSAADGVKRALSSLSMGQAAALLPLLPPAPTDAHDPAQQKAIYDLIEALVNLEVSL